MPSLSFGAAEVTPFEVAVAYSTLAKVAYGLGPWRSERDGSQRPGVERSATLEASK